MSLGAKKLLDCSDKSVDDWAADRFRAVVCFPAADLRDANVQVGWDPTDDDPAHCNAWGKLRKSLQKYFAKCAGRSFFDS